MIALFVRMSAPTAKQSLLSLAWPIFIEQTLRILVGTVDTFMVSYIADSAVAGLNVANQIVVLFLIVFNFIAIGTSVVTTHHLGAKDRAGAEAIATNSIAANTWMGLAVSISVFTFATPMLRLMQLPPEPLHYAKPFLTLMGGTLFLESMNMSIAAVLRAHKHTRDAMFVTGAQNIVNVLGNCVMLFGLFGLPKMGVLGVAISSVTSRCLACIALWILLDYRTKLRLRARDFVSISWQRIRRVLRIGLPGAGENMSYWLALMVVTTFTARMGSDALAMQSYAQQVQRLVILFSISLGLGTEIVIGHLIGAGAFEDAYREVLKSVRLGLGIAFGASIVVAFFSPRLMHLFTSNASIIAGGVTLIWFSILIEPGRVFNIVIINSLRATGDVYFPIQMAFLSMWCVWIPLAWFLSMKCGLGLLGIWISMATDEWTRGVMMYHRWKNRRWLPAAERSRAHAAAESAAAEAATTA